MHPAIRLRSRQPQRNRADSPARLVQVSRPPGMRPIGAGSPHLMRARAAFSPATAETRARTTLRETKPRAVLSGGPFASAPVYVIAGRTAPRGKARNCR
jgi:UDP-N-acetylglucosamine:LPS N-acetylglucosamine transferase